MLEVVTLLQLAPHTASPAILSGMWYPLRYAAKPAVKRTYVYVFLFLRCICVYLYIIHIRYMCTYVFTWLPVPKLHMYMNIHDFTCV